jgi:isoamylase
VRADRLLEPAQHVPLGATWDGRGTGFAVYAPDAERVELCLFDAAHRHDTARLAMPECVDGVWRGYLPDCRPGQLYGYRAFGPYAPERGQRFNGHKLLLDPYARALAGELRWHDALYGYRIGARRGDLSFDRRDSAPYMPRAVVCDEHFDWGHDRPPRVPWSETVIYEAHVRGLSKLRADLPGHDRGTFGALGHERVIDHLRRLGVTAVELLPVHAFVRDRALLERGLTNYWGYNTLAYFAPDPSYLSDGTLGQLKWAVRQLHAAGIEVILDVVYNHTAEGSELGPTLSLRGFGNPVYYRLNPEAPRHHVDDTGCGNTLNVREPRVLQMIMDSLRYWVTEFHVDGFRFDLGVTLGREAEGFDPGAGFFDALLQDPVLAQAKLITEPWDLGPGGWQVGRHPARFSEWNDKYRDEVRRFWRGDAGMRGALAARLQGSADLFDHHRRRPWASVNFVTAHDGFTLADLTRYTAKQNEANGEDNRDGTDANYSANWGAEGPAAEPPIADTRARVARAMLATLLASHGTPMLLGGDEFGRTQRGNNNAYCQDNELSWFDWAQAQGEAGSALAAFVTRLIRLRREHPSLRSPYFQHGRYEPAAGVRDVQWFNETGVEMTVEDWQFAEGRLLIARRAVRCADGSADVTALLINGTPDEHAFTLPPPALPWRVVLDSARPDAPEQPLAAPAPAPALAVAPRSVQVLAASAPAQPWQVEPGVAAPQPRDYAPTPG